ncbi:hypothetical protein LN108_005115, partial [Salmonella enterica]|nr:hypothetical protein [Salmonella enterica]
MFEQGNIALYGELSTHKSATNIAATLDVFRVQDAKSYCDALVRSNPGANGAGDMHAAASAIVVARGLPTGGRVTGDAEMKSLQMGGIAAGITTGGDSNPEIFVSGLGSASQGVGQYVGDNEVMGNLDGAVIPKALVFVNGSRGASTKWTILDQLEISGSPGNNFEISIGHRLAAYTGWNLSDAYYVNNWPGAPYTAHKGNGDSAYHYVTQVNYIT